MTTPATDTISIFHGYFFVFKTGIHFKRNFTIDFLNRWHHASDGEEVGGSDIVLSLYRRDNSLLEDKNLHAGKYMSKYMSLQLLLMSLLIMCNQQLGNIFYIPNVFVLSHHKGPSSYWNCPHMVKKGTTPGLCILQIFGQSVPNVNTRGLCQVSEESEAIFATSTAETSS